MVFFQYQNTVFLFCRQVDMGCENVEEVTMKFKCINKLCFTPKNKDKHDLKQDYSILFRLSYCLKIVSTPFGEVFLYPSEGDNHVY